MIAWMSGHVPEIVFAGCIVLSVGALELMRLWLQRRPADAAREPAYGVAALLGFVFAAMLAGGLADFALTGVTSFVNLTLVLTGLASLAALGDLLWRYATGRSMAADAFAGGSGGDELRRAVARDL